MFPRRAPKTFGIREGDLVSISPAHARAIALGGSLDEHHLDRLKDEAGRDEARRLEAASFTVTEDLGDGRYLLLQEGTGHEVAAPGEEISILCEDDLGDED